MKNSAKRSPNPTTLLYRDHNVTTRTHQKMNGEFYKDAEILKKLYLT
ncbi:hypothetical protein LEP1GSC111_2639 [Leptospira interrogans str. UT126]|uniref:Uncharacterized protein n=1 Tax=Leptospira interrogans str. 2006001854 TaxID=1001590 RepID=M6GI04_LEPIR|nr:hypothetical protein LEP1GSC111_2639 [Leptospira interrogans str. UT126]EMM84618.1 hypothetical protein LEP1GSC037_0548 [Leptospira interrogans str. 2006001854]